jgi:hypothetical protein
VINAELSGWQVTGSPSESKRRVERRVGWGCEWRPRCSMRLIDGLPMRNDDIAVFKCTVSQVVFSEKFHEK